MKFTEKGSFLVPQILAVMMSYSGRQDKILGLQIKRCTMSNLNVINKEKAHIKDNFVHDTCIFSFFS